MGLRAAVLVASFFLFFFPLTSLGMVSPYAIRLRTERLDEVGKTAGNIYAISTMASVFAALLTGFVLIPNVGVSRLVLLIGAFLLLGSLVALLAGRESKRATAIVVVLLLAGGAIAWITPSDRPDPERGILLIEQSPYAEIRVVDHEGWRHLLIDGGTHTISHPETRDSHHPYAMAFEVTKHLFEGTGNRMLLVGLGGGSVARSFSRAHWKVDAVEIDPVVVRVARKYFGLEEEDATVHIMDGRRFFLQQENTYDYIVLDAFGSSAIPFHLITREFFGLAKSRLAVGGVLAINLESRGWDDILVRSVAATLRTQFASVLALPTVEPPDQLGNVVVIASDRSMEFPLEDLPVAFDYLYDSYEHWRVVEMNHHWANRHEPEAAGARILTDDSNPVDIWAEAINLEARMGLHDYFGVDDPSW